MHWKKPNENLDSVLTIKLIKPNVEPQEQFFFWDMPAKQMMLFFFNFIHLNVCLLTDIRNI